MAEAQILTTEPPITGQAATSSSPTPNHQTRQKNGPSIHEIYALPAPVRTFPLPAFYPNNPVSLFYLAYAWLGQVFRPPPAEPAVVHRGVWSPATNSVHLYDEKSVRALWEQGFYGKGSLSRSEPNWLKREKVRRGLGQGHVSEIFTVQRREERVQAKWERARLAQEAIRQTRLEEARQKAAARQDTKPRPSCRLPLKSVAPVGPLELLSLPNSEVEFLASLQLPSEARQAPSTNGDIAGLGNPSELNLPSGVLEDVPMASVTRNATGLDLADVIVTQPVENQTNGLNTPNGSRPRSASRSILSTETSSDSSETRTVKRRKSVRFSPKVESTTFQHSDPPSPNHTVTNSKSNGLPFLNGTADTQNRVDVSSQPMDSQLINGASRDGSQDEIVDEEHLQLTPEEAFFLVFGLGALVVKDPTSNSDLSSKELFTLFRQYSYFSPRIGPDDDELLPDDNFLVHYAVYHHFRSMGWVPRGGIKFGVDWLLYTRGPVFDHAEFGLIVIPSYSDPWWKAMGKQSPQKTWQWLHNLIRVLAHVTKSLVLVYVDVPPPPKFDEAMENGFADALKLYTIREVMVKRWSSNRNR